MKIESDDPVILRQEINTILDKVKDRGSLAFFQWLITKISKDEQLPPEKELKKLHGAFIRVVERLRDKKKQVDPADWNLMAKYVEGLDDHN